MRSLRFIKNKYLRRTVLVIIIIPLGVLQLLANIWDGFIDMLEDAAGAFKSSWRDQS